MTGVLIAFVIVVLIPLFVATWRTSLLGLALQGALLAWLSLRPETTLSFDSVFTALDVVVLRSVVAPVLLFSVMRRRNAPACQATGTTAAARPRRGTVTCCRPDARVCR
jgi:hypothetical protein